MEVLSRAGILFIRIQGGRILEANLASLDAGLASAGPE
jgi:hypothetical protein